MAKGIPFGRRATATAGVDDEPVMVRDERWGWLCDDSPVFERDFGAGERYLNDVAGWFWEDVNDDGTHDLDDLMVEYFQVNKDDSGSESWCHSTRWRLDKHVKWIPLTRAARELAALLDGLK